MKVIIINGPGGSGKDSFVKFCKELYGNVLSVSTVDYIKTIAKNYLGWNGQKDEKGRRLLSDLKDATSRYNNLPNKSIDNFVKEWANAEHTLIFIHAREPENIQYFVDKYNAITVFVSKEELTKKHYGNHADDNVFDYIYDWYIDNDGTLEDLKEKAKIFLDNIK